MKRIFTILILIFSSFAYLFSAKFILNDTNFSLIGGLVIVLIDLLIFLIIGLLISKILFHIKFDKKLTFLSYNNFEGKYLSASIKATLISLLVYFSILYLVIFLNNDWFFESVGGDTGMFNTAKYISKILFTSLPVYAFSLTYIEYCNFLKAYSSIQILLILKTFLLILSSAILKYLYGFNGFLYAKIAIDFLFFAYYIIKLREIILLTNLKGANQYEQTN